MQLRGSNYLVPVNANPVREADVDFQMLDASLVLRQMDGAGTKLNIVILDACRNNPFGSRNLRMMQRGLAQMQAPEGTLISYATQPGNVALDGVDGNSPYAAALVSAIRKPDLDIFRTFNEVGLEVKRLTGGEQQPWVSASPIAGTFHFTKGGSVSPQPLVSAVAIPAVPATAVVPAPEEARTLIAAGEMQRLREIAARKRLPLADFDVDAAAGRLPEAQRRFVGVWISNYGFNRIGRQAMIVVHRVDPGGRVEGIFSWGPPTPKMPPEMQKRPAGFSPLEGKLSGNQIVFNHTNFVLTVTLNADNTMTIENRLRSGQVGLTVGAPVWQLSSAMAAGARK